MYNCNLCASIKSKKKSDIQCQNKPKNNNLFCGKHQINPIFFKKELYIEEFKEDENIELTLNELFNNVIEKKSMSIYIIRKTIKNSYLKGLINTKLSKPKLINNIKEFIIRERYIVNNEDKVIKIQSFIRMFIKRYKYLCVNEIDILTMNNKMEIPYPYFYKFYNKDNQKNYAYDIRFLNELINSNYQSCPYTLRKFDLSEIQNIKNYINNLKKYNIIIDIEKILSEEEIIENKVKELFYSINMLDNYTNHKWFMNLNLLDLIKLYISAEDIWNYRSLLNIQAKYNIIKNNHIFNIPIPLIKKIKNINKLRNILIDTFNIMISNGIDINEKKLGAILVLSSLVEISNDAAYALPHLIQ